MRMAAIAGLVVACSDRPAVVATVPASRDAAVATLPASADAGVPAAPPTATLRLAAHCDTGELAIELAAPLTGIPEYQLEDRVFGSSGMAKLVTSAEASDRRGPLPLKRTDGEALVLRASRPADGLVTLRYRVKSVETKRTTSRPLAPST